VRLSTDAVARAGLEAREQGVAARRDGVAALAPRGEQRYDERLLFILIQVDWGIVVSTCL
jgi:hypothetical protein